MPHAMPCTGWTKPKGVPVNVPLNTEIDNPAPILLSAYTTLNGMPCNAQTLVIFAPTADSSDFLWLLINMRPSSHHAHTQQWVHPASPVSRCTPELAHLHNHQLAHLQTHPVAHTRLLHTPASHTTCPTCAPITQPHIAHQHLLEVVLLAYP